MVWIGPIVRGRVTGRKVLAGLPGKPGRCYHEAMNDNVTIRPAQRGDLEPLAAMWEELMDLTAVFNPRYRLRAGSVDLQRAVFVDYLRRQGAYVLVGEVDGQVVSFSNGYVTLPAKTFAQAVIGVLENLFVGDQWRRMGIGKQMADAAIERLVDQGAQEIYVNVIPGNGASVKFWRAMGFEVQRLAMTRLP